MSALRIERPDFFEGQYLGADDLDNLVNYTRDRHARHALGGHTWGIAMGLELTEVESPDGDLEVYIQPGYAWDGYGRPIVVLAPYPLPKDLFATCPSGNIEIWLHYDERPTEGVRPGFEVCDATDEYRRIWETFDVKVGAKPSLKSRQDGLTIAGIEVEDARNSFRTFVEDAPLVCDGSIPHQALPASNENPQWLVPLGVVKWVAGSPGHFEKSEEEELKRTRILRRYVGLVAEAIHAAGGVIRLRRRTDEAVEGQSVDDICKTDRLEESDLTYEDGKLSVKDLVWVEENLRVDKDVKVSGKVGIGTTDPKVKLQIEGGKDAELGSGGFIVIGSEAGCNVAIDNNEIMARNNGEKSPLFLQAEGGDLHIHSNQPGQAQFIIKDSGNVGIGTISPNRKLEIKREGNKTELSINENLFLDGAGGTVRVTNNAYFDNGSWAIKDSANKAFTLEIRDSGKLELYGTKTDGQTDWRKMATFDAPNNKVIFPNGNVGIGTAEPKYGLDIRKSVHNGFSVGQGSDSGRIWTEYLNNGPNLIFYDYDDPGIIRFRQSPSTDDENSPEYEAFISGKNGNVGIGTINPDSKLAVNGNIKRQGHTVLDRGNTRVASKIFEPSPYWSGTSNIDVAGFFLSITVPTSGTLIAHMNALVQMSAAGKAVYLGPKINGTIDLGNRGGYRAKNDIDPKWLGTAAFNVRQVSVGSHTVQVHANIDGGTALIAWGSLLVQFFPD
jgi:hypothetical protein